MLAESERQLLGAWISGYNQEHIPEFTHFSIYAEVFQAVKKLKTINIVSVAKETNTNVSEIAELVTDYMPSMYEGAYRYLKEEKIKGMIARVTKNPAKLEEQMQAISREMETLQATRIKPPADMTEEYQTELEKRKTSMALRYKLPTLDYITGGLRNKELTVIAARPSIGKTALAWQIAFNIALDKNKVLFFPLEMSSSQLMERLACRETTIPHERLKTPSKFTDEDKRQLNVFMESYKATVKPYLNVIEGVSTLTEIKAHIEHYKPSAVFIDQLSQLKEKQKFKDFRQQFTYMTNTLKKMCMELDIPIVLLAQISRGGQNTIPTLIDLKESGSIEEDADNVLMIHQEGDSINEFTPMQIIVRKQRNGARDIFIPATYLNKKFVFREVAK